MRAIDLCSISPFLKHQINTLNYWMECARGRLRRYGRYTPPLKWIKNKSVLISRITQYWLLCNKCLSSRIRLQSIDCYVAYKMSWRFYRSFSFQVISQVIAWCLHVYELGSLHWYITVACVSSWERCVY